MHSGDSALPFPVIRRIRDFVFTSSSILVIMTVSTPAQELPAAHGCVSVTTHGALPNDALDDTQGFQKALEATIGNGQWSQCYVPPGTYIVSNTIGGWTDTPLEWRFFTLQGAGPEKTIIRLKANSAGFSDPVNPKPVFHFRFGSPNFTHSLFVENLTIEVDTGNAGATALMMSAHNGGGITNVTLRALGTSGYIGLDKSESPGPEYTKGLKVYGFTKGVYIAGGAAGGYSVTMEDIYLEGQRLYGIQNKGCPLQVRKFVSKNTVTAISSGGAMLHVIDAVLQGGKTGGFGIASEAALYLRNVTSEGSAYTYTALDASVAPRADLTGRVWEYVSPPVRSTYSSPARSLGLEIKDVPSVAWDVPANWVSATGGFQAAVSSGKSTIYFPANSSPSGGEVHINSSTVKRIVGLGRDYPGKVVFDNTDANSVVVVEKLRFGGGVEVKSAGKVVLKSFMGNVTISGTGETYIEDYCCGTIVNNGGRVWARQINTENGGSTPIFDYRLKNNGGQMVFIGVKTEGGDGVLGNTNGAKTDILGGFLYPGTWFGAPTDPAFLNDNSDIFVSANYGAWAYPSFITETRGTATQVVSPTFGSAMIYVTNPNGSQAALPSVAVVEVKIGARMQGNVLVASTPAGSTHAVRVVDMTGRVVRENRGFGAREYRLTGLRSGVYVVNVRAGTEALTQTLTVR